MLHGTKTNSCVDILKCQRSLQRHQLWRAQPVASWMQAVHLWLDCCQLVETVGIRLCDEHRLFERLDSLCNVNGFFLLGGVIIGIWSDFYNHVMVQHMSYFLLNGLWILDPDFPLSGPCTVTFWDSDCTYETCDGPLLFSHHQPQRCVCVCVSVFLYMNGTGHLIFPQD